MKRFPKLVTILLVLLALTACSPVVSALPNSPAVQIPPELKVAFNGLMLFGITFAAQWFFEKTKVDLRGFAVGLSVILAEALLLQFQGWIDVVPAKYDLYVNLGLNILITVLATLGYIRLALFGAPRRLL